MGGENDTELWQRSAAGDSGAFALLFDRHHPRVHRHAHRLVANRLDAEDLTAGTFLELWRRRRRDVRLIDGSLLPWLLVTTSNLARNHARGLRRHRTFLDRLHLLHPHPAVTTDDVQQDGTAWAALDGPWARALTQLNAADLRLVTLVVLEEQSSADAAALLGLTPQAAKSRMHRARQRLRNAMAPDGHPPPVADQRVPRSDPTASPESSPHSSPGASSTAVSRQMRGEQR